MSALPDFVDRNADAFTSAWHVVAIVVLAGALRSLTHRAIRRLVSGALRRTLPDAVLPLLGRTAPQEAEQTPLLTERRRQRTETIGSLLRSVATVVIAAVAGAMVLAELGFNLGPVLASAGIVGVALGFGAQNLVKDVLNGMFMILEDQFGVGDAIDVGPASGIVESVGLRVTRLRSVDGTVWHVRNGEILRIGNMSQDWSRALLDVPVAYGTDTDRAAALLQEVADGLHGELGQVVLEKPEVWGVEDLGADGIVLRLVVKTAPLQQWTVARELRRRIMRSFAEAGVEVPVHHRTVWLRDAQAGGADSVQPSAG